MKNFLWFIIIKIAYFNISFAQTHYSLANAIIVEKDSQILQNPYAGGLNYPQFSQTDLNQDGWKDLVIFDRSDQAILCFLYDKQTSNYDYVVDYETSFPTINHWMFLKDYNHDGVADLFVGEEMAMKVYQGSYDIAGNLSFELVWNPLVDKNNEIIPTIFEDIPTLVDMDDDGDLDLLITDRESGNSFLYYQNYSLETVEHPDSLLLQLSDNCWGNVYANLGNYQLDTCGVAGKIRNIELEKSAQHFQRNILALDTDGDQDKDLLVGNITDGYLQHLRNDGTLQETRIGNIDWQFPHSSQAVDLTFQACPFIIDVNQDGKNDLVVSKTEQGAINNNKVVWYYENNSSNTVPSFLLQNQQFMIDEMIDVGEYATPTFVDYNKDGLLDLVIGNSGNSMEENANTYAANLTLYENMGTAEQAKFVYKDHDFAKLQQYAFRYIHPSFGDLDNDGDADLLIGEQDGQFYFFENQSGQFLLNLDWTDTNMDVGQHSTPVLFDLDKDGDLDIVSGNLGGNLYFYENQGTKEQANFQIITSRLGGLNHSTYTVPILYYNTSLEKIVLGVSTETGHIEWWTNLSDQLPFGPFTNLTDEVPSPPLNQGQRLAIVVADISNDDKAEWLVGGQRGGISIWTTDKQLMVEQEICNEGITLDLKVFLEGAYNEERQQMNNDLQSNQLLPIKQPYNLTPWHYKGTESLDTSKKTTIVDWLLVEIYQATDSTLLEQQALILSTEGKLLDASTHQSPCWEQLAINTAYFMIIRHRNHLDIISDVFIPNSLSFYYDFTSTDHAIQETAQMKHLGNNQWGLYTGDIDGDGRITVSDYNQYQGNSTAINTYCPEDLNLDGMVTVADFNGYLANVSKLGNNMISY